MTDDVPTLDRQGWRAALDHADGDPPSPLNVADVLTDRDLTPVDDLADAQRVVYAALDGDGPLVDVDAGVFGGVALAGTDAPDIGDDGHRDSGETRSPEGGSRGPNPGCDADDPDSAPAVVDEWSAADFDAPTPATWSPDWGERERWMGRIPDDKHSFAPWADRNAPAPCTNDDHDADTTADCSCDARYKWGYQPNYADLETAREWADMHPDLGGVTFQLVESDDEPFAFVDGDDVRDPETGDVHPAFVDLLDRLGMSYADVSTSGGGVHVAYRGDLPDGVKQAKIPLDDESFGTNDEPPVAEIYDHKKVCVATGDHVPGTPLDVRPWDDDALAEVLDEHGLLTDDRPPVDNRRESFDPAEYEPDGDPSFRCRSRPPSSCSRCSRCCSAEIVRARRSANWSTAFAAPAAASAGLVPPSSS